MQTSPAVTLNYIPEQRGIFWGYWGPNLNMQLLYLPRQASNLARPLLISSFQTGMCLMSSDMSVLWGSSTIGCSFGFAVDCSTRYPMLRYHTEGLFTPFHQEAFRNVCFGNGVALFLEHQSGLGGKLPPWPSLPLGWHHWHSQVSQQR